MSSKKLLALLIITLMTGLVGCGSEKQEKKKETEKVEVFTQEDALVDDEAEQTVEVDKQENDKKEEEKDNKDEETPVDTSGSAEKKPTSSNNNITVNKPSSGSNITEPKPSHIHKWVEVKKQVAVPETGHYETIFEWKYYCETCMTDITDWSSKDFAKHCEDNGCANMKVGRREEVGQKWIVDTPATTESRVTGYKCSCGATREKTQYSGMYTIYDQASWDALERCKTLFRNGLAGEGSTFYDTSANYGYWESVCVCNSSSDGAWMWIFIRDWKLKDYSYLQDGVKEGIIDQEEAKQVQAVYEEIPSIFKRTIECIAPQGGAELYNYVEKLIVQAEGNPDNVHKLSGAKGNLPENIPGLYVTIEETRGGFSLMFWAE